MNDNIILSELQAFRKESTEKFDKIDERLRLIEIDTGIIKNQNKF